MCLYNASLGAFAANLIAGTSWQQMSSKDFHSQRIKIPWQTRIESRLNRKYPLNKMGNSVRDRNSRYSKERTLFSQISTDVLEVGREGKEK